MPSPRSEPVFPLVAHYRAMKSKPLSRDEAGAADFETRFNSIAHFAVRECLWCYRGLSKEGKASYDPDDIMSEIWVELSIKNDKYDSERSDYIIFALTVMRRKFAFIRGHSRCVRLPENVNYRFRLAAEGSLSETQMENLGCILDAARDHHGFKAEDVSASKLYDFDAHDITAEPLSGRPGPPEELQRNEETDESCERVSQLLSLLDPVEQLAVCAWYGVLDVDQGRLTDVSHETGITLKELKKALISGKLKLNLK